jgi:hypothetical protein
MKNIAISIQALAKTSKRRLLSAFVITKFHLALKYTYGVAAFRLEKPELRSKKRIKVPLSL